MAKAAKKQIINYNLPETTTYPCRGTKSGMEITKSTSWLSGNTLNQLRKQGITIYGDVNLGE